MANSVKTTPLFESKYKRLSKKYRSLNDELAALENELLLNPETGEALGANIYKVRLASKDKGKGKSGGFRVITYLIENNIDSCDIYLIIIYDKSEQSTINKADLIKLVKSVF